jgi:hypothetical protein
LGDRPIDDRNDFPGIVLAGRRADVLPLMSGAAGAHRHLPRANLAIRVALTHRIIVDRIALAAAGFAFAIPAAATMTPDLGVQVRMLIGR